jgi:hypothetical protein
MTYRTSAGPAELERPLQLTIFHVCVGSVVEVALSSVPSSLGTRVPPTTHIVPHPTLLVSGGALLSDVSRAALQVFDVHLVHPGVVPVPGCLQSWCLRPAAGCATFPTAWGASNNKTNDACWFRFGLLTSFWQFCHVPGEPPLQLAATEPEAEATPAVASARGSRRYVCDGSQPHQRHLLARSLAAYAVLPSTFGFSRRGWLEPPRKS